MRRCCLCDLAPRRDDPMRMVQYPGSDGGTVTATACTPCAARVLGLPPVAAQVHPPGRNLPFVVCGLCRLAARDDDQGTQAIRLHPDDLAAVRGMVHPVRPEAPGCYAACRECVNWWRPVIEARLRTSGVLGDYEPFTPSHLL
ncbi:MAG: hypothetical protein V4597_11610 [Pseudomonadota bacterium]